jgi:uncharacterized protein (TIGR02246 family)
MKRLLFVMTLTTTLFAAGCAAEAPAPVEPPDTRAQDEAAIRSAAQEMVAAAAAKDVEKFVSFYADDAVVMLSGAPDLDGKAAIRETLGGMMMDPAFALKFDVKQVEVARSGDIAYGTDDYVITTTDAATKKPVTETGHSALVWKKQNGEWKLRIDAPLSDPAAK